MMVQSMRRERIKNKCLILLALATLVGCGPQPTQPMDKTSFDFEGLEQVPSQHFTAVFGRLGTDFTNYDGVIVNDVQLAFRTPDRSKNQFPVNKENKDRFKSFLKDQFINEFENLENIELVEEPGPAVIDLHVRVQDILATIPGRRVGAAGRATFALEALGEITLVIELRDSESEEVLVRVFDQRALEGVAMLQDDKPVTRWPDIEEICKQWALRVREGLDVLVGGEY